MSVNTTNRYTEGVGRRKTAVARARLRPQSKQSTTVNGKELFVYFPVRELQNDVLSPLKVAESLPTFEISVKVTGGGIASQAGAIRHAISRALEKYNESLRKDLKKAGFLKRDPRAKERKKFGLKKARKAPQWSKR